MTPDKAAEIIDEIIAKDDLMGDVYLTPEMNEALEFAKKILKNQRPICKYICPDAEGSNVCAECLTSITSKVYNFCPETGADLRGEEE